MHDVRCLIARSEVLEKHVRDLNKAVLCPLAQGFSLVPITDALAVELETRKCSAADVPIDEISAQLCYFAQELSIYTSIAYITTCFYGGDGGRDAVVWCDEEIIFSPRSPLYAGSFTDNPINKALRLIGVVTEEEKDEFDSIGLGKHSSTETWAASVIQILNQKVMEVGLNANMVDATTDKVAHTLWPILSELSKRLKGEYGGLIEHLWIDLELVESHSREDGKPLHPFRFQKRVSGRGHFGLPPSPDAFNVGHFSVRPDFSRISSLPDEQAIHYALSLIYKASEVLLEKQKKLGGFNAVLFRERFKSECQNLGFQCEE